MKTISLSERGLALVGKSNFLFDIPTDFIFIGNGGTKAEKLVYNVEGVVAGRNLGCHTPLLHAFIDRLTKAVSCLMALKAAVTIDNIRSLEK